MPAPGRYGIAIFTAAQKTKLTSSPITAPMTKPPNLLAKFSTGSLNTRSNSITTIFKTITDAKNTTSTARASEIVFAAGSTT